MESANVFFAITPQQFSSIFYLLFWQGLLVVSAVSFVKLSIAFFLLRLAQRTQYRRFLYGVIGLYYHLKQCSYV
jgi:hypothetical protein